MKKMIIYTLFFTFFIYSNQIFANGVVANGNFKQKFLKETAFYSLRLANALIKCLKTRPKSLEVLKETVAENAIAFLRDFFDMHGA